MSMDEELRRLITGIRRPQRPAALPTDEQINKQAAKEGHAVKKANGNRVHKS
jgi:hypothetical protein